MPHSWRRQWPNRYGHVTVDALPPQLMATRNSGHRYNTFKHSMATDVSVTMYYVAMTLLESSKRAAYSGITTRRKKSCASNCRPSPKKTSVPKMFIERQTYWCSFGLLSRSFTETKLLAVCYAAIFITFCIGHYSSCPFEQLRNITRNVTK